MLKTSRLTTALTVAVVAGLTLIGPARADVRTTDGQALDGYLYVGKEGSGGCKLGGSGSLGACVNQDVSFINRGFTSSKPNAFLYWGAGYTGAYACIPPHGLWYRSSSSLKIVFDHKGTGGDVRGLHQTIWDNVASVKWSNTPCSYYP